MDAHDEIAAARGHVSNLWHSLEADEPFLRAAFRLYESAMRVPGGLPIRDRELLCLATSVANKCGYCAAHHRRHLLREGFPEEQLTRLERGETLADPRDEALRGLAFALAAAAAAPVAPHRLALKSIGLDDLAFQQAVQVCATYAMFNRLALPLETPLEADLFPLPGA